MLVPLVQSDSLCHSISANNLRAGMGTALRILPLDLDADSSSGQSRPRQSERLVLVDAPMTRAGFSGPSAPSLAVLSAGAFSRWKPVSGAVAAVILLAGAALLNYPSKAKAIL